MRKQTLCLYLFMWPTTWAELLKLGANEKIVEEEGKTKKRVQYCWRLDLLEFFFLQFSGWIFFPFFLICWIQKKRWREKRKEMKNELSELLKAFKRKLKDNTNECNKLILWNWIPFLCIYHETVSCLNNLGC